MKPESRLVKQAKRYLTSVGARSFKIHGGDTFQEVGIPDLLVCYQGYFIGIEFKLPGEEPSAIQRLTLRSIERAGGYTLIATSVDDVRQLITALDKLPRK